MDNDYKYFLGNWVSEHGQRLTIRHLPILGIVATLKPVNGHTKWLLSCSYLNGELYVGLSFLHWLGAMLILSQASGAETKRDLLVPTLEAGPESNWEDDNFGVNWAAPLSIFKRI